MSRAMEYITLIVHIATVLVEAQLCITAKICSDATPYSRHCIHNLSCYFLPTEAFGH